MCLSNVVVHSLSHVLLFAALQTAACQASLPLIISWSLLKFMSIKSLMPSSISSSVLPFSSCPQSSPASGFFPVNRLFASGGQSWGFSISPCNEYPGLISFRIDWFDLLAVQWTLKSLLQHHSLKTSLIRCSAFFMAQL